MCDWLKVYFISTHISFYFYRANLFHSYHDNLIKYDWEYRKKYKVKQFSDFLSKVHLSSFVIDVVFGTQFLSLNKGVESI